MLLKLSDSAAFVAFVALHLPTIRRLNIGVFPSPSKKYSTPGEECFQHPLQIDSTKQAPSRKVWQQQGTNFRAQYREVRAVAIRGPAIRDGDSIFMRQQR